MKRRARLTFMLLIATAVLCGSFVHAWLTQNQLERTEALLQRQAELTQRLVEQNALERETGAINTLYETIDGCETSVCLSMPLPAHSAPWAAAQQVTCRPQSCVKANTRLREEAIVVYAEMRRRAHKPILLNRLDLRWANLRKVDLSGAHLRGALLKGSNLSGANLSGADLQGAQLEHVNLSGTNLTGAKLDGVDMFAIRSSPTTQWPEDFEHLAQEGWDWSTWTADDLE